MRLPILALLLLPFLLLSACASGPRKLRPRLDLPKDVPVFVAPVKNLSGVPLSKIDPDIYTADNLEHANKLSGGATLSMPELLREAFKVVLKDEGFHVTEDAKARYHVLLSISEWSGKTIDEDGRIWLGVDGFLIDQENPQRPVTQATSKRYHQLLSGEPDEAGIVGSMRLVGGAHQRMSLDAALDLLIEAGVIAPDQFKK